MSVPDSLPLGAITYVDVPPTRTSVSARCTVKPSIVEACSCPPFRTTHASNTTSGGASINLSSLSFTHAVPPDT